MATDGGGCTVGVDVGGTKMLVALVDAEGRVLSEESRPTGPTSNPEEIMGSIVASVRRMTDQSREKPHGVGVGIAAQVDTHGTVRFAPNLHWSDVPIGRRMTDALELPVSVVNDVRAATIAEWRFGSARGESDVVCLLIGTGVGGGVISGHRLLTGVSNTAGELGHMTIVAGGRPCSCRNVGCLEAYVGGWAIAARARDAADAYPAEAARFLERMGRSIADVDAEAVFRLAGGGDPFAQRIVAETRSYLAAGLVAIANSFNPRLFVAGGGVVLGGGRMFEDALALALPRILPSAAQSLRSVRAQLGENAVALGAAAWARQTPEAG
jgi:glucokinase